MIKEAILAASLTFTPANFNQAAEEEVYPGWKIGCEGIDQLIEDVSTFKKQTEGVIGQIEETITAKGFEEQKLESAVNSHNILVMVFRELTTLEYEVKYFKITNCQSH